MTYSKSVTGVATETLTSSANLNGNSTVTVGGTVTVGDVVSLTVENINLTGGEETVTYTVASGNTTTDVATGLKNAINASSSLSAIGVTSTSASAVVTISTAGTTYTTSISGGATETLTLGTNANGNTTVVVGGKPTNGDTVTVVTHNPLLPGGQESVGYTVGASDTLVDVAGGLAANMTANSDLQALGVTANNNDPADLAFSQSFSGNGTIPAGASLAKVSATDAVPTTKTDTNSLKVTASTSSTLTWDANGNMTSDGTNTYKWDAENRLIEIDYPGVNNFTQLSYDGLWRNTKIVETTSGSVTSTKQFVVAVGVKHEERDAGSSVTRRFFGWGQTISGTSYFYAKPLLDSVTEMTDGSGALQAQYFFDSYGRGTKIQGSLDSDILYAGYYRHQRSGFDLTVFRAYFAQTGRWINRDPLEEEGDVNPFTYVGNNPISGRDPLGLFVVPVGILLGEMLAEGISGTLIGIGIGIGITNTAHPKPVAPPDSTASHDPANPTQTTGYDPASTQNNSPVNPGRDGNGCCKPCPPNQYWMHPNIPGKANYGSKTGFHYHALIWNQGPDCTCRPDRLSQGTPFH